MGARIQVLPASLLGALALLAALTLEAEEAAPIRIAGSHWVADAPTKLADVMGLFNAESASPQIRVDQYDSGHQALASLLAGESEFALAASTPVARALLDRTRGAREIPELAVLAAVSLSNRTHVVVADSGAGINVPADLQGKRVGVMLDTSGHFGWHQFTMHHGLDVETMTLVDLPVSEHAAAMADGRIQAAATWEPWASLLLDGLSADSQVFTTRHLYSVAWLLVTRSDVLDAHPGLAERVLTSYREAISIMDRDPDGARARYASGGPVDVDLDGLAVLETGIVWGLRLDWSILADLEAQFLWLSGDSPFRTSALPAPYDYLNAAPMRAVSESGINLPEYFFTQKAAAGDPGAR
jgi:NitT/TauT family transport system substrate-binding protein